MNEFCLLSHSDKFYLFANADDLFIKSLPDHGEIFGLPCKKINHNHLFFFEKIINNLGNDFVFVDVGAYLGTISLLLAIYLSERNINCPFYLFEPNDKNFNCLSESLKLNKLNNVFLFSNAVSDFVGECGFSVRGQNHVAGRISHKIDEKIVKSTTLDNELKIANKNIIIKIDTEGNEVNVLKGMIDLINNNNCVLILEVHIFSLENYVTEEEDLFQFLKNRYDLFAVENIGYPKNFKKIENKKELINSCTRDNLTDVICFPNIMNNSFLDSNL